MLIRVFTVLPRSTLMVRHGSKRIKRTKEKLRRKGSEVVQRIRRRWGNMEEYSAVRWKVCG